MSGFKLAIKRNFLPLLLRSEKLTDLTCQFATKTISRSRESTVVMFHTGRSGSSVIGTLLNQNPEIHWAGEIFSRLRRSIPPSHFMSRNPHLWLELNRSISPDSNYGFEVKWRNIYARHQKAKFDLDALLKTINDDHKWYFIMLQRRNYLRILVSARVGKEVGYWNSGSPQQTNVQVSINPKRAFQNYSILEYFEIFDDYFEYLRRYFEERSINPLLVSYEDDVLADPKVAYLRICEHIGVQPGNPVVKLKKLNRRKLSETVTNFEEVRCSLAGSNYEWMLDE